LALSGEKTIAELSAEFGVHQTQIHRRVKQLKESAVGRSRRKRPKEKKNFMSCTPQSANLLWNAIF
jgi:transposase-like protein